MATLERRGNSYRLQWRLGGVRSGARQSASFTAPKLSAAEKLATQAKLLVEAHKHRITRDEVLKVILGQDDTVPDGAITLADWVKLWEQERRPVSEVPGADDIQPDTLDGYMQILRARVLPYLGHKYLHEINED